MIKNLVLQGGGVKGIAYAGAIKVLEDKGILKNLEKTAGVSAGAITATVIALNYSASETYSLISGLDFTSFKDNKDIFRLLTTYGVYAGDSFLQWIKGVIKEKTGSETTTFAELKLQNFKDLHILATELNSHGIKIFNAQNTPDVIVAEAVRASMSIPLFFKAFSFSQGIDPKNVYVDGGMVWNFPLEIFDTENTINTETLGLCLWDYDGQTAHSPVSFNNLESYIKVLVNTLSYAQSVVVGRTIENDFRKIKIADFAIDPTDFTISEADKLRLYQSGIDYTTDFFKLIVTI